jgi:hypothetical protein
MKLISSEEEIIVLRSQLLQLNYEIEQVFVLG